MIVVPNIRNRLSQPNAFRSFSSCAMFPARGVIFTPYSLIQHVKGLADTDSPLSALNASGFAFFRSSRSPHRMKSFSLSSARACGFSRRLSRIFQMLGLILLIYAIAKDYGICGRAKALNTHLTASIQSKNTASVSAT